MATQVQLKRTTVTGRTPNTTSSGNSTYISAGELAINLTDGKLFSSNGTSLIYIGSNVATLNVTSSANLPNTVTVSGTSGTNGQYLGIVGANLAFASLPPTIAVYDAANTLLANAYFVTGSAINQLSDVDTATTAPANNNLLMWSNGVSNWVPSGNVNVQLISINGNKAVNGPAFGAYANNTLQNITSGIQQKVLFQTEEFDTDNCFANSRFTPSVTGYYQLNASVRLDGNTGTGETMIVIWKNSNEHKRGWNSTGVAMTTAGGWFDMTVSSLVYANGTTDYFEVAVQQTSGANNTVTAVANPAITYFNGAMVRGA